MLQVKVSLHPADGRASFFISRGVDDDKLVTPFYGSYYTKYKKMLSRQASKSPKKGLFLFVLKVKNKFHKVLCKEEDRC